MKLLVVILNYRVTDLTLDCLESLAPVVPETPGVRVALLENGTGGDAFARLRRRIDERGWGTWVDLAEVHPNRGFTGGNNIVLREALASADPPEYFLLLNADTVVQPRSLSALVEFMDAHPRAGVAGSALVFPDGTPQGSPFRFMSVASELDRGFRTGLVTRLLSRWTVTRPKPSIAAPVDWVSGASMILRRTMLEEIGLLDEGLYTYFDDIDLCLRARRAGWETWYVPESRVVHLEGSSTGIAQLVKRVPGYWFQARRRFWLKNHGPVITALADAAFLSGFSFWLLRCRLERKRDPYPPHLLADAARHSVYRTGFAVTEVQNPAMAPNAPAPRP